MGRTSVALTAGGALLVRRLDGGRSQAEQLIPLVGELMAEAAYPFSSLDRIAVCIGPGGFSGIRSGVAAARGIGLAAGIPVVGATSFRIMSAAFELEEGIPETYGLAATAGLNSFYCQVLGRGGSELSPIVALPHSDIAAFFEGEVEIVAGPQPAALLASGAIQQSFKVAEIIPDAITLAAIAPGLDPLRDLPSPRYVRPADARPQGTHVIARQPD